LPALDAQALPSAWEESVAANAHSHTEGGVSKACFVFASRKGWSWQPYPTTRAVGALAQRVTGDLGLQYEEIKYDATLRTKLEETNKSKVPTVIFGDPGSLLDVSYARPMQEYDNQYLLNCAALIPWDAVSQRDGDNDHRWIHLRTQVCRQKTEAPPPYHEWRSIFSPEDLEVKTRTTIEQVRSRLMKQLMSVPPPGAAGAPTTVRKAEDPAATDNAAALGIRTESPAQLEGPTR
jgi:hypothetical protein